MPKLERSECDWHWLAGIFEGEGCAALRYNKARWAGSPRRAYLYVSISQTNEAMLREVQRISGLGKIYGSRHKQANRKPLWQWQVACRTARVFLTALRPYIRSPHKLSQVDDALAEDRLARAEGTAKRRETLRAGSVKRWAVYHANLSRKQA